MEIFIDFRKVEDKASLAQAIKVFAMTYKDDIINVIIGDDKSTLVEGSNVKFIHEINEEEITNLYTIDSTFVDDKMMKLAFLKPSTKEIQAVAVGDLNNNGWSLKQRFELLKQHRLITDKRNFAILTTSAGIPEEYNIFNEEQKDNENYLGIVTPKDIVPKGVLNILTTTETANIFIDSLYYSVEFLRLKKDDEEKSPNVFEKLFSWNKDATPKEVIINTLMYDFNLYLNDKKFIFIAKDNMNYNYYYQSLNVFYNMLKR